MTINEAKAKLKELKGHIESLKQKQAGLVVRLTDVRESLPVLQRAVNTARLNRQKVSDAVVLCESSMDDLGKCDAALEVAEKKYADGQRLFDALTREIKTLESAIPRKMDEAESLKRQLWEAISAEFENKITSEIKDSVRKIVVIACQLGHPRQLILDTLFKNPTHDEVLAIQKQLRERHEIND